MTRASRHIWAAIESPRFHHHLRALGTLTVGCLLVAGCTDAADSASNSSAATTTLPSTTIVPPSTTVASATTTAPVVFTASWVGDDLVMRRSDGSLGPSLGPPFCLAHEGDLCAWSVLFAAESMPNGVVDGFVGDALLVRLVTPGSEDMYEVVDSVPLAVITGAGTAVFRQDGEGRGHVIALNWTDDGPLETAAWLAVPGSLAPVAEPRGLAASIGPGAERAIGQTGVFSAVTGSEWVEISGPTLTPLGLWEFSGWMIDEIHAIAAFSEEPDEIVPVEVWLEQRLGWAPDGTSLWWLLDRSEVPAGVRTVSSPGECSADDRQVVCGLHREACDRCAPDGRWAVVLGEDLSLVPIDPAAVTCTCVCEE